MAASGIVTWFEIPATDFARAEAFYRAVFSIDMKIERCPDTGTRLGVFVWPGEGPHGAIMEAGDCQPAQSTVIYLNGGADLQPLLDKVVAAGGKILLPKMALPPEWGGFIAHFADTEGNRVGLHSAN